MSTLTNLFQKVKRKLISLLLWSERYTKTDMLYLARSGAWLVLRRAVLMGSAFALALAFANLVSKETYGTYKYILSTVSILSTLTLSGMGTAIIQSVARGFDKTLIDGYKIKFKWDIIASIISLGLGIYYFANGNAAFAIVYWFFAALFPFWDAASHYDDYLQGKTDFKTSARFDALQQFALAVALIAAIFFYPEKFAVFVILWLVIQTFFTTWYYRKIKNLIPANAASDPQAITYAKHLSVFSIITVVSDRLDNILIFQLLGPAQL
ncbi:oligosaccharide flippase family protein, partial [Patescibacteria group bacterium]|nr:oligosaccharide flippase family protein [Patescibacteria group bacterium]